MKNRSLEGRVIAVTGGFGVLGRAIGEALHAAGGRTILIDKAAALHAMPSSLVALGGIDLGHALPARQALADAASRFGGLDGLVNVAGGFCWETIEAGSVDTWDQLYQTNVRTTLLASQAALPHLLARGRGRIVNVGAAAAAHARLGMGAYAASKSGVARLTEAMADEFKDRGITVNAVLPGVIDTPANRADMPQADPGRWVAPSALAEVILFLLTDAAAAVNGALIPVKGSGAVDS
jgi:NAD(P)-dependent dehydrogenase (short-subunit alcohol dehydrogenase family)